MHEAGPPRLSVAVVGVGRAGSVLAAALDRAGHPVIAADARSSAARERASQLLPDAEITDLAGAFGRADLVLVTVPDDVLVPLVEGAASGGLVRNGQVLVHASGRIGTEVFEQAQAAGAAVLALHPAMTLTGTSLDLQRLMDCPFAVTSAEPVRPIAEALVVEMGGEPIWVPEAARPVYHAALSHAANHLITLVSDSVDVLDQAGVAQPSRLLGPLLQASLENALESGDAALTGPISRGDVGTVVTHLEVLGGLDAGLTRSYRAMAERTAHRAMRSGRLSRTRGLAVQRVLGDTKGPTEDD